MSTPEPLDEFPGGQPETRGGDQLADITVVPDVPLLSMPPARGCGDPECGCGADD